MDDMGCSSDHNRSPLRAEDIEEVRSILSKISIFAGLSDAQLDAVFALLEKMRYAAGEKIFEQGSPPSDIYIIERGKVKLVADAEGTTLELAVLEQGQCIGETSVIGIVTHGATAVAMEETDLIVLSRQAILSLYKSDVELFAVLIWDIAREACRRLHKADEVLLHYVETQ